MTEQPEKTGKKRSYPGSYDKLIPIALAIIAIAIVAVLAFALVVALGLVPGSY
jgi:hypothetical protein